MNWTRFSLVVLLVLVVAACRPDDPYQPADPADPEPAPAGDMVPEPPSPSSMPPIDADAVIDSLTVEQPVVRQPGEVVRIDPAQVIAVSVDGPDRAYSIERRPEPRVVRGADAQPASASAIEALLARYAPLEGQEVLQELHPEHVRSQATHRIILHMEDGTARDVSFVERGAYVAAVGQPGGPVYRLAVAQLSALVPVLDDMK